MGQACNYVSASSMSAFPNSQCGNPSTAGMQQVHCPRQGHMAGGPVGAHHPALLFATSHMLQLPALIAIGIKSGGKWTLHGQWLIRCCIFVNMCFSLPQPSKGV